VPPGSSATVRLVQPALGRRHEHARRPPLREAAEKVDQHPLRGELGDQIEQPFLDCHLTTQRNYTAYRKAKAPRRTENRHPIATVRTTSQRKRCEFLSSASHDRGLVLLRSPSSRRDVITLTQTNRERAHTSRPSSPRRLRMQSAFGHCDGSMQSFVRRTLAPSTCRARSCCPSR